MILPSLERATLSSSVCAAKLGRVIGHGDHSSAPARKDGICTGGVVNWRIEGLTYSSIVLDGVFNIAQVKPTVTDTYVT